MQALFIFACSYQVQAQDWVRTGTNLGATKIRLAAADFKPTSNDPQTGSLKSAFDTTLFNDLSNAGIFDMVSKSMAPPQSCLARRRRSSLHSGLPLPRMRTW